MDAATREHSFWGNIALVQGPLFDRFLDALTSAKRRDHAVLVALAGYAFIWTLYAVIAKSSQDLHPDMTELIAWSRDLSFGFPKHPPFAAIVVRGWFAWLPIAGWTFYLLAMLMATATLWIAWELFGGYLNPAKRLVALCLLTFIPFFNFHALKFNVNTMLMPLWAVTTLCFLRSYRTRSSSYAALAGLGAALCMVTKYWSVCLLVGLAVAALSDPRRRAYFRSPAPWITVLTGMVVISPHIGWLEKHNFSPLDYAMLVHGDQSYGQAALDALRYCIDSLAYVCVPVGLVLLLAPPYRTSILDRVWPRDRERRLVTVVFWATLMAPILPAVLWGISINGIWTMSAWTLLPILLLSSPTIKLRPQAVSWTAGIALVLLLVFHVMAPAVAYVMHVQGLGPNLTQSKQLAKQVEAAWHSATRAPLRYVGGDESHGVVAYAQDRPRALLGLPLRKPASLRKNGMVLICYAEETTCISRSATAARSNPKTQKIETELTRTYFGRAGQPQHYVIFVIPPTDNISN